MYPWMIQTQKDHSKQIFQQNVNKREPAACCGGLLSV